ncbi:TRM11 family SAM-dependent methyltransferase [Nocardia sp. NPDC050406]|uniref:TRM11 family SAM-dependent methyltransferase n=1 Tax=Nocardia sp. NPDC050406 TaxID=3364318 RepID=UPI00379053CE
MGHREVHFQTSRPHPMITRLRTADDVFLLAFRGPDIGSAKTSVAALGERVSDIDTPALLESRRLCGGPGGLGGGVEVSASFLGRRNFNRYDIEDVVGGALGARLGLDYHSRRNGNRPKLSCSGWRLSLNGKQALLMLRITERPLHRRMYKQQTIPGSVHPPLASVMAEIAAIRASDRVLDPCCGAGTLLIEAADRQPDASYIGYDLNPTALRAARSNSVPDMTIERADAGDLPLASNSVDRVLCNPPWDGQVPARGLLAGGLNRLWVELRRVLEPDGSAVVLLSDTSELAIATSAGFTPTHLQQVRLSGRHTFIVHLRPRHGSSRGKQGQ